MEDTLINLKKDWERDWTEAGMPEYDQKDQKPWQTLEVHLTCPEDREDLARLIKQEISPTAKYIWFPEVRKKTWSKRPEGAVIVPPNKYPIYVISKGGAARELQTIQALDALGIKYWLVVDNFEYDQYVDRVPQDRILQLPPNSAPSGRSFTFTRNWCWGHSVYKEKAARHWILDDDIDAFYFLNENKKPKVTTKNPFLLMEQFTDRFKNIGISGPAYEAYTQRRNEIPPYDTNTSIYACLLVRNDLPFRWEGNYYIETDLCIRSLKHQEATVLFNYIQTKRSKRPPLPKKDTPEFVAFSDKSLEMTTAIRDRHPSLVTITKRWGYWQFMVNWKRLGRIPLALA